MVIPVAVAVGKDILVHPAIRAEEVIQEEILHAGKNIPAVQEREDLAFMAVNQVLVRALLVISPAVFHSIFFGKTLYLTVPEHGQTGHGCHQGADAKVFITFAKLVHCGAFIRVIHEIDVTLEDLRVKFQGVLHQRAVLGIILISQQVHKRAVVHPVHPERADKIAFHQPESLCQKEGIGYLCRHTVDHLAPEFQRERPVKIRLGHTVLSAGGDVAAAAWFGEPQALVMALG